MALFGFGKKENKSKVVADKTKSESSVKGEPKSFVGLRATIVKHPVISEKAMGLEPKGQYVFEVAEKATKAEVKKEVEKLFSVKVAKVNVINVKASPIVFRGRRGYRSGFRKAVVKLGPGYKITVYQQTK